MLSYEEKKMDTLISKAPTDIPRELLPTNSIDQHSFSRRDRTIATKVPEAAGIAAIEKKVPRNHLEVMARSRYKHEKSIMSDELIKETSDAILNKIPEVLDDPFRLNIYDTKPQITKCPEQPLSEPVAMSRMEYIKYVREQCEKELSYVPKRPIEMILEKVEKEDEVPITEGEEEVSTPLQVEQTEETSVKLPLILKENLTESMTMDMIKDTPKSRFLRLLWIRSIIAMCLFIGIVAFDLLNVRFGVVGIRNVKDVVTNNDTIHKIEKVVSDFTENTLLPVFGVDKQEGQ